HGVEGCMGRRGRIRIRAGAGRCASCGQPHALDIAYRCVGCDEEVCALCVVVVRETRESWCPECEPEGGS
ncbi:MAG: hypothetical protein ACOCVZ_07485, partial [Gemmatimonadota bacterium]